MTQPSSVKTGRFAVIIPVCNEAECLGDVLDELKLQLASDRFVIAVGLNGTTDGSGKIAAGKGVLTGETAERGYGFGCLAAIEALEQAGEAVDGYVFVAGDGANRPEDVQRLVDLHEGTGARFVMGLRYFEWEIWRQEFGRALPNLVLGLVSAILTGRFYHDLGPLRLIERDLFERLELLELTWGWTMEAQIVASRLGEKIETISVTERPRRAGKQKVSGVSLWRSAWIGWQICLAAVRARFRKLEGGAPSRP